MPVCAACGVQTPEQARFCPACGSPVATARARPESRRRVTIVFSDLAGSTALGEQLDPEALRRIMARYFQEMRAAVERHGGVVEKFIGDAVMAVFGIPARREDDALRAVRAAADMRAAQERLNRDLERRYGVRLGVRTGVNTGEVVAGDPGLGQAFVTGDAVNVAARLEQAAAAGEVLIGPETERLVRHAASLEPIPPLALKGKSEPLPAYRLIEIGAARTRPRRSRRSSGARRSWPACARPSSAASPTGGACWSRCAAPRASASPAWSASSRRARRGRALPARPLPLLRRRRHVLAARGGRAGGRRHPPRGARRGGTGQARRLLAGEEEAVASLVASLIGLGDRAQRPEESSWAVRRLMRASRAGAGLVVVLDDCSGPSRASARWSRTSPGSTAPLLLLCIGRPELADVAARARRRARRRSRCRRWRARQPAAGRQLGGAWSRWSPRASPRPPAATRCSSPSSCAR